MDCGDPLALSVIVTAAESAPVVVGAKWPWMEQFAPAARLVPQLFPKTKEDAFVPVTVMLLKVSVALPVFVNVTDCEALDEPTVSVPNDKLVAERDTAGPNPVPLSAIACGELPALSVMVIDAVRSPVVVGEKWP
jgi:hypothetical protein